MAISKSRLKLYRALSQAKGRRESGLFLVEGPELIKEALQEGWPLKEVVVTHSLAKDTDLGSELIALLDLAEVPYEFCSQSDMDRLAAAVTPQGIAALAYQNPEREDRKSPEVNQLLLICTRISDPGNLGTILRTADWFGVSTVLLGAGSVDSFNPKVVRASAGSIFRLRIEAVQDILKRIKSESHQERKLFAATMSGELLPIDLPGEGLRGLVVGHEKEGVPDKIASLCSATVRIESRGRTESLNLAVATGILLYALRAR